MAPKKIKGDPLVSSGFAGNIKFKKLKGGPSALSFRWPDLASVVLVVSVKMGPISVSSVVWRKRVSVRVGHFLEENAPTKNRPLRRTLSSLF